MGAKRRRPATPPAGGTQAAPQGTAAVPRRRQERTLEKAVRCHQAGDFATAVRLYRQARRRDPRNADLLHLLGVATFQAQGGPSDEAIRSLEQAVALRPDAPAFRSNLGNVLRAGGRLDEAIAQYQKALSLQPGFADAHHNLARALHDRGRLDEAISHYATALRLNPHAARSHNGLGEAHRDKGDANEARRQFERALALDPASPESHANLADLLGGQGQLDAAVQHYHRAIALRPDRAEYHLRLARFLRARGKIAEAVEHLAKAASLEPDSAGAHTHLAGVLAELGRPDEAFDHVEKALALRPDMASARAIFAALVKYAGVTAHDPALEARLVESFDSPYADAADLARVAAGQLRMKYGIRRTDDGGLLPEIDDDLVARLAGDELLQRLLTLTVNPDPDLELFLTPLRRRLLRDHADADDAPPALRGLISALAQQCFNNEYVFAAGEDEDRALHTIRAGLERGGTAAAEPPDDVRVLLLAMYEPLGRLAQAAELARIPEDRWRRELRPLVRRTLLQPAEESELADAIPSLADETGGRGKVSQAVRAQYEENPYPRWLSLARRLAQPYAEILKTSFPHFSPAPVLDGPVRVLVAGCGTGKHPVNVATTYADAEVVAVDLSRRSLAYAMRMARELGVDNIHFMQGDVLDLAAMGEAFPVIECIGVLHHMERPMDGWRVLTNLLAPGGVMEIGLYSAKAREDVVRARRRIADAGLTPTAGDIRRFRHRILLGEEETDLRRLLDSEDFFSMSGCRDLLFNVQEHRFTVPEIRAALEAQGLRFVGFNIPSPLIIEQYRKSFPQDTDMTDLDSWNRFEDSLPNAFCEMYQFLCYKPVG